MTLRGARSQFCPAGGWLGDFFCHFLLGFFFAVEVVGSSPPGGKLPFVFFFLIMKRGFGLGPGQATPKALQSH